MKNIRNLPAEGQQSPKRRGKHILWAILGIIIVLPLIGGIIGIKVFQFKAMGDAEAHQTMPPQVVNAVRVRAEKWQPNLSSVGTVMAVQGTVVSTEAEGVVREIAFEAGSRVEAGDVLVRLNVDIEQAQLRAAEADAKWAQVSFKRAKALIGPHVISKADYDAAENTWKQARARVDNLRAVIAKKTVRAPFSGKLGIRKISVGQFLEKGRPVVSLHSLDPVYVDFSLPQQRLGDLTEGLKVTVSSDAFKEQPFEGRITAINPEIDADTRNVRIQATLANPQGRLRPGMFVTVDTFLQKSEKVVLIPAAAVMHAPFGDSVFIIEEGKTAGPDGVKPLVVRQQFVRLGQRRGDFVAATEGVRIGEQIVATGTFKLRPGMAVVIDNTLEPQFKLAPTPDNT